MIKNEGITDWREDRRRSAHDAIIDAAWALVSEEGLAALTLRDLARRAGITAPTVYSYFESKNDIYDAMFGRAAAAFAQQMAEPYADGHPREVLAASVRRFFDFCIDSPARYQLLFQRTIPGFAPSAESYAPAERALALAIERLSLIGISEVRHVDIWTALLTGLVDQQMSNDPGGDRWTRLIDETVDMFFTHCRATALPKQSALRPVQTKGILK